MSVIDDVRKDREDLARVLKKHVGIRKIVEDLYPDSAHFIFELLQNAEDRGATEVHFRLTDTSLRFEHNGETFRQKDIEGITDIGEGTKAGDDDKIGRFGVGFKSVFAYSETPHIWSPTFSFKISELVLPWELPLASDIAALTRFDFPFDNPKKAPADAYREIASGLDELAETTLLFLRHIETIQWHVEGRQSGTIMRVEHAGPHVEVLKQLNGTTTTGAHFLKFEQPVPGLGNNRTTAVAFALDFLPNVTSFAANKPLSRQFRIVPASGQVAVFFPAAKETSGLRFHLHAPFVPELSRASIKETPANKPLFVQLAALAAASLHTIRDLGLLVPDFLGVLPNMQDELSPRYVAIREAIIAAMNNEPLTPTYAKTHAPARQLVQGKAALKDLLGADDIEFLTDYDEPPQWAASRALQGTNVERFMNGLEIKDWDFDAFIELIAEKAKGGSSGNAAFVGWLSGKSIEWHQQLYALLDRENDGWYDIHRLKSCRIVRLTGGGYSVGERCHFPDEKGHRADGVAYVDAAVYATGKSKADQESARKFLGELGVTEVGERELVSVLLKGTYTGSNKVNAREHFEHLCRFAKLLEEDSSNAALLASHPIFVGADENWHKPADIYLDRPFGDSGFSEYMQIPGASRTLHPLADFYQKFPVKTLNIARFAQQLGSSSTIALSRVSCTDNPEWNRLSSVAGERYTSPIDRDFAIPKFQQLVAKKSHRLAKLVWNTMRSLQIPEYSYDSAHSDNPLRATYRKNERGGARFAPSQLVYQLRRHAWVPQRGDNFVRPADARVELLPGGFTFDPEWAWIEAIEFGKNIKLLDAKAKEEEAANAARAKLDDEAAKALGFEDAETARRVAEIPQDELREIVTEWHNRHRVELPDHQPLNADRRVEGVRARAGDAPKRQTEIRQRSVSVERDAVKDEAKQYLRQLYTNGSSEQICQICKDVLPFKLADGSFYFDAVELLPELQRHHRENYLCLCPNHAAMFQHANASKQALRDAIATLAGNHLSVVLAQEDATIYFTATHLLDLKTVLIVDNV